MDTLPSVLPQKAWDFQADKPSSQHISMRARTKASIRANVRVKFILFRVLMFLSKFLFCFIGSKLSDEVDIFSGKPTPDLFSFEQR
jgi:hypothetical protein